MLRGIQVSSGGIWGVWQRHGLLTKHEWLLRLEQATAERKLELSDEQIRLLERFSPEFRARHIEAPRTGALVAVDTFFIGVLKGVGKVYLQTAIDCHFSLRLGPALTQQSADHRGAAARQRRVPHIRGSRRRHRRRAQRQGREFCGREDRHPCELFLQLEGIAHKTTGVHRPQSNGIVERLHRTLLDEHFRVEGRRTWFETIEELQAVLNTYCTDAFRRFTTGGGYGMLGAYGSGCLSLGLG